MVKSQNSLMFRRDKNRVRQQVLHLDLFQATRQALELNAGPEKEIPGCLQQNICCAQQILLDRHRPSSILP